MTLAIRKILLPTDFGPSSERAATHAAAIARGLGASVHLVHVLDEPFVTPGAWHLRPTERADFREQRYHESRAKLAALATTILQHATDRITIEVRTGTPAEAIVDAAVDYGADLIVMSAPVRNGLSNIVMGSVAERVLRAAPCPVLAVRPSGAARVHARKRVA